MLVRIINHVALIVGMTADKQVHVMNCVHMCMSIYLHTHSIVLHTSPVLLAC